MNKKRLSVVMAGAMLVSSVAPVLAAENTTKKDYEVNGSNKGLLIRDLRNLLTSKVFENVKENEELAGKSVHYVTITTATKKVDEVGSSYVNFLDAVNNDLLALGSKEKLEFKDLDKKVDGKTQTVTKNNVSVTFKTTASDKANAEYSISVKFDNDNIPALETAIQNATTGTVVKVWDNGHIEKDGKFYGKALETTTVAGKLTAADLKTEYDWFKAHNSVNGTVDKRLHYPAVYDMTLENDVLTVYTRQADTEEESGRKKFEFKVGDDYVDFTKAIDAQGKLLETDFTDENGQSWITHNIAGFAIHENHDKTINKGDDIANVLLHTITITDVDNVYNVKLSDLYDGLFLTEKGEELLAAMKEYDAEGHSVTKKVIVKTEANGLYTATIEFAKEVNKEKINTVVKVTTNDKAKLDIFANGISVVKDTFHGKVIRKFPVQKLAGDNRYETAVKVAKENADIKTVAKNGNIVLVNGNSLVDGLAAAPLAASVWNKDTAEDLVAPILLTETNGLPKATKDYMRELVAHQQVGALDKVTVYLVGGEAVISKAVENDLKEIGLRVVRAGGKDREATSLEVAKLIEKDTNKTFKEAFVVGADGEADAMSVASYAADTTTPIIVESRHGLSEESVEYLKGYKKDEGKDVTIVGGESVVSAATEAELKAEKIDVDRLAGKDRQATNAKVIKTLYSNNKVNQIVVSKDGKGNKSELIDALTATSLAAADHSPIVLGTNSLTEEQINALELKARRDGVYVYQVGHGVSKDVIKTIASRINLAK